MKTFFFTAGLPRSGSTLLQNILAQNPRFYATPTSGLVEVVRGIKDGWARVVPFNAIDAHESRRIFLGCISGIFEGAYKHIEQPVIFEKNRGWPAFIGLLKNVLPYDVKMIACVREPREILASLEKRWRETDTFGQAPRPQKVDMSSLEARLKYFASNIGPLGAPYILLSEAMKMSFQEQIHFVEFETLTKDPELTMRRIYQFINEDVFEHDFDNVVQVTHEDDRFHGYVGLHDIRSKVEPIKNTFPDILGKSAKPFENQAFWRNL